MDKAQAARRLSASLGRQIKASEVDLVSSEDMVRLKDGGLFQLFAGNSCFVGGETPCYMKNGRKWDPGPDEKGIRPSTSH